MSTTTDRDARDTQRRADQTKKEEQKLVQQIARCFNECQRSRAGHRKTALIMKKLQAEGITDATGQKVKPKTFSKWFGGYIDLIIGLGLAFGLYIVYTIIMPMADSALGMAPKEKKEKKKSSTPRGSTKKKR